MASYKLCIALFLIASAATFAYGGLLTNLVAQVEVSGLLVCSATGNQVKDVVSPGIAGVDVDVSCNNGQLSLGTLKTDATGHFAGTLKPAAGGLFDPSTCFADVKLPVVDCNLLPSSGILRSALVIVGDLISTLNGLLANLAFTVWQIV